MFAVQSSSTSVVVVVKVQGSVKKEHLQRQPQQQQQNRILAFINIDPGFPGFFISPVLRLVQFILT